MFHWMISIPLALFMGCEPLCDVIPDLCILPVNEEAPLPEEEPSIDPGQEEYRCSVQEVEVDGRCVSDADGDGVRQTDDEWNPIDNCPEQFNPDQLDRDGDGVGAACEAVSVFTWMRGDRAVFNPQTREVGLRVACVEEERLVLTVESPDVSGEDFDRLETIELVIPFGDYGVNVECYTLFRQNAQQTPDLIAPNPGEASYRIGWDTTVSQVLVEGAFQGFWKAN